MSGGQVFYPGVGADEAMSELNKLVGQITANWANVEDGLFQVFVLAIAGTGLVQDIRPYRAVFFTFGSYEGKMRMVHNAMKTRFADEANVMGNWMVLRKALNGYAELRNEIAHLIPMAKSFTEPTTPANVRLIPAFWKGLHDGKEFDEAGYSFKEVWKALKPYWGYHPYFDPEPQQGEERYQLAFRLQQFAMGLERQRPSPPAG
jgi:hypothetical protein